MNKRPQKPNNNPLLFEVAWEVCNQIGGIHTVIKSKVCSMQEYWKDNYLLLGPYNEKACAIELEENSAKGWLKDVLQELSIAGVKTHYGSWLIPGKPKVLLFDYKSRIKNLDTDKYLLWKDHAVSSPPDDPIVNDTVAFGFQLAEFFKILCTKTQTRQLIAHFHEWMAGLAIARIKHLCLPINTIFTTHATLLGRSLAGENSNFYSNISNIDVEQAVNRHNLGARHYIECLCALSANVFSSVSDITAKEAQKFLGRKADNILPNGINIQKFTALHEFQNLHLKYKERIHEFVMGHFFPSYTFELDRTLYLFTSGRYEYTNKGMDIFIEALYRLNQRLKNDPKAPTIVAFIVTKANTKGINLRTLQNQSSLEDLKHICADVKSTIDQRLLNSIVRGHFPAYEELLPHNFQVQLKRAQYVLKSDLLPSIVTHDLYDDTHDSVLNHLRHRQLFNAPGDPVKVVYHPDFLSATNPLFNLDYDQFVRGCHLGVFPSLYEPWGYTPLECLALGLPTVTTDVSGFGSYVKNTMSNHNQDGIYVLNRSSYSAIQTIDDLTDYLFSFSKLSRRERIELRNRSERISENFDWYNLVQHYNSAYQSFLAPTKIIRIGSKDLEAAVTHQSS